MQMGIRDWPEYISEIFRVSAPGGHTQFTEIGMEFISNNNALGSDAALEVIQKALQKYASIHRLNFQVGSKLAEMVRRAGFHSVEEKVVDVPCGSWPTGNIAYDYC
jgi:ubiquinone/menaquinone biosynthesis C-methylase UbiE